MQIRTFFRFAVFFLFVWMFCPLQQAQAADCNISVAPNVNFGQVDVTSGSYVDTSATFTITCTNQTFLPSPMNVCIYLGAGSGGGTSNSRKMTSGASALLYGFFQDAGRSAAWGVGTGMALPQFNFPSLGGSATKTFTIYGRLPAGQSAATVGSYSSLFSGVANLKITWSFWPYQSGCTTFTSGNSATFSVLANVAPSCNVSANDLNFGNVNRLDGTEVAQTNIRTTCTSGVGYTLSLDGGLANATDPTQRSLANGANSFTYGLYQDSAHTRPFGSLPGAVYTGSGNGTAQTIPVYGLINNQAVVPPPGLYSDRVVVTLTY